MIKDASIGGQVFEIAGVPFEVHCRYPENYHFMEDYRTNKQPLFTLEPSEDDLKLMQCDFDSIAEARGYKKIQYSGFFLENNIILARLSEQMAAYDVLQLHGSAVCMDGEAYIFIAPSGTGKSTHARLWKEAFGNRVWMINDDKPLLKITDNGIVAYGSPWRGKHELGCTSSAPVRAIAWLNQGEANHIEPMSKTDSFPIVFRQCYCPRNETVAKKIMTLVKEVLERVSVYRLCCNTSQEAAFVSREGMK